MLTVAKIFVAVLFLLPAGPAAAQSPSPPPPAAASPPGETGTAAADPCAANPLVATPLSRRVAVIVNPATTWQPRRGEVLVELRGSRDLLAGQRISACWRWGEGSISDPASKRPFSRGLIRNRPSDKEELVNFGVTVPYLDDAPEWFLARVLPGGKLWTDGFGTVPVAELHLILDNGRDPPEAVVEHIGITSPWVALAIAALITGIALRIMFRFADSRNAPGTGAIRLISGADNMASLSALQILLWSATVAFSAIYVMCLTGNLINLTPGTLVLLGVSGATTLATVLQPARHTQAIEQRAATARREVVQGAAPPAEREEMLQQIDQRAAVERGLISRAPSWSDLIAPVDGAAGVDMSRAQMLFFTLVTAVFVLLNVLKTYVIPDIPEYYQALIGISNGVYVATRAGTIQKHDA